MESLQNKSIEELREFVQTAEPENEIQLFQVLMAAHILEAMEELEDLRESA